MNGIGLRICSVAKELVPKPVRDLATSTTKVFGKNPSEDDCKNFVKAAIRVAAAAVIAFASLAVAIAAGVATAAVLGSFVTLGSAILIGKAVTVVLRLALPFAAARFVSKSSALTGASVSCYLSGLVNLVEGAVTANPFVAIMGVGEAAIGLVVGRRYDHKDRGFFTKKIEDLSTRWGSELYRWKASRSLTELIKA